LSRLFCQVLRECAPEAAHAFCLRARPSRVATQTVAPLGFFGIKDLNDLLIKKLRRDDLAFQQFDNLAMG
jgi:hypothetical protein